METSEMVNYIQNKYKVFLKNTSRNTLSVFMRSVAAYELKLAGATYPQIREVTKRHRNTIYYYIKLVDGKVAHYRHIPFIVEKLKPYDKIEDALADSEFCSKLTTGLRYVINNNLALFLPNLNEDKKNTLRLAIKKILHRYNGFINTPNLPQKTSIAEIVAIYELWQLGLSVKEISRITGRSGSAVYQSIRRLLTKNYQPHCYAKAIVDALNDYDNLADALADTRFYQVVPFECVPNLREIKSQRSNICNH